MAKIMYVEITALSNKWGYCTASNTYFANLYEVSPLTVSRWMSQLRKYGFVRVVVDQSKGNERKVYPNDQNVNTYIQKDQEGIDEKINRGIDKKIKYNNTSINTTRINTTEVCDSLNIKFNKFWNLYSKKVERKKCEAKFRRLKSSEIDSILIHVPTYVKSTPDERYRKNPLTYLNGECWNDAIIAPREKPNYLKVATGEEYKRKAREAAILTNTKVYSM